MFVSSLKNEVISWFWSLPISSIASWNDMLEAFLSKYGSMGKYIEEDIIKREETSNTLKENDEDLNDYTSHSSSKLLQGTTYHLNEK